MVTYHATRITRDPTTEERRLAEPFDHRFGLTLAEAAAILNIDENELLWAIEECGECELDDWVVAEDE